MSDFSIDSYTLKGVEIRVGSPVRHFFKRNSMGFVTAIYYDGLFSIWVRWSDREEPNHQIPMDLIPISPMEALAECGNP